MDDTHATRLQVFRLPQGLTGVCLLMSSKTLCHSRIHSGSYTVIEASADSRCMDHAPPSGGWRC